MTSNNNVSYAAMFTNVGDLCIYELPQWDEEWCLGVNHTSASYAYVDINKGYLNFVTKGGTTYWRSQYGAGGMDSKSPDVSSLVFMTDKRLALINSTVGLTDSSNGAYPSGWSCDGSYGGYLYSTSSSVGQLIYPSSSCEVNSTISPTAISGLCFTVKIPEESTGDSEFSTIIGMLLIAAVAVGMVLLCAVSHLFVLIRIMRRLRESVPQAYNAIPLATVLMHVRGDRDDDAETVSSASIHSDNGRDREDVEQNRSENMDDGGIVGDLNLLEGEEVVIINALAITGGMELIEAESSVNVTNCPRNGTNRQYYHSFRTFGSSGTYVHDHESANMGVEDISVQFVNDAISDSDGDNAEGNTNDRNILLEAEPIGVVGISSREV